MKYESLIEGILLQIGGKENVSYATHCMTRLRLNLKDTGLVNEKEIKNMKGVLGCQFSGGQFQIIIGQHVDQVYKEFIQVTGLEAQAAVDENLDGPKEKLTLKQIPGKVMDAIIGCITPLLPLMSAAGIFKLLSALLGSQMTGWLPDDSALITLFTFVGDAGFYFIPVFVAWAASKKFKTSTPLAIFLATIMIHPTFIGMVGTDVSFNVYGIPAAVINYSSQFLPSILVVWVLSYVHKFFDRISPNSLRVLFVPTCTMLVMLPIALCALGPAGYFIGQGLGYLIEGLYGVAGPLAGGLVGGLWFFLIATGMHQTLIAVAISNIMMFGFDGTILPESIAGTWAMYGMALAYIIRCQKEDRALAGTNMITFFFGGISEPTIFTTLLRFKQAMIAYFAGGFVGGMLIEILEIKIYFSASNNFLSFLGFGADAMRGLIPCVVAAVISFIAAMVLGFKDKEDKEGVITSPLSGDIIPLEEVKDQTFSSGMMGVGCAIIPKDGKVVAPFDGEVISVFPTNHAIGLKRADGLELLIHIGLDTVNEKGNGFTAKVKVGDQIKKGQLLIKFDKAMLENKGYDLTTPVIITNARALVEVAESKKVKTGQMILKEV